MNFLSEEQRVPYHRATCPRSCFARSPAERAASRFMTPRQSPYAFPVKIAALAYR